MDNGSRSKALRLRSKKPLRLPAPHSAKTLDDSKKSGKGWASLIKTRTLGVIHKHVLFKICRMLYILRPRFTFHSPKPA